MLTPDLKIIGANDAYLEATAKTRDALVGHGAFEAFPGNPNDERSDSVSQLRASFQRSPRTLTRDTLPLQRYDLQDEQGRRTTRYWHTVNWPILDDQGSVVALAHRTVGVTRNVRAIADHDDRGRRRRPDREPLSSM